MKFTILIFTSTLLSCIVAQTRGQHVTIHSDYKKQHLDIFVNELKKQGVDTILIYSIDGYGQKVNLNYIPDSILSRPTYVLWKRNNYTDLKRFDIYYTYKPIQLIQDTIIKYAFKYFDAISKENIQCYENKLGDSLLFKSPSHYDFCTVTLLLGVNKYTYQIADYNINNKKINETIRLTYQFRLLMAIKSTIRLTSVKQMKREKY